MKPLSEWPTDRLTEWIAGGGFDPMKAVAELLRRERERCASLCDEMVKVEQDAHDKAEPNTLARVLARGAMYAASMLAQRIRGLS